MPEHKGTVAAKSEYGIKFSEDGPWFNWALPAKRGQPFDDVSKGDSVRIEYDSYEKKDKSKGWNIYVIENLSRPGGIGPQADAPFPPDEAFPGDEAGTPFPTDAPSAPPAGETSTDRQTSIVRQTCIKSAAMALQHGMGTPEEKAGGILYLAGELENWVNRA